MMDLTKDAQEKVQQLQMLEQNIQHFFMQKQQFQAQLLEYESALKELSGSGKSYKIIGNVMVEAKQDDLKSEMEEKLETVKLRILTVEKQEAKLKEKVKALQSEVMGSMSDKNDK